MKGLFIVLEGIDCSGKSTQAELLIDYFVSKDCEAVLSPEPSAGPIGNLIREIMKGRVSLTKDAQKFDEQLAYLFAADRHDHLYNDVDGVFKLIRDRCSVICTRYTFSSLAYNCNTPEEFEFVSCLNQRFPNPDLLVYLDIPVNIAISRLNQQRTIREVYETEEKLTKVSQNYQRIFQAYDGLILRLDGTLNKHSIRQRIVEFIENNLSE